jgi:hypothetical protein
MVGEHHAAVESCRRDAAGPADFAAVMTDAETAEWTIRLMRDTLPPEEGYVVEQYESGVAFLAGQYLEGLVVEPVGDQLIDHFVESLLSVAERFEGWFGGVERLQASDEQREVLADALGRLSALGERLS